MRYARTADGTVIEAAASGARALCPACHGEVLAKCGDLVVNHWAHRARDCDPWSEPETEWHRAWKSYAPAHRQEVVMGPHRADLVAPNGVVVEIQHSNISGDEIRERERFYKRLLWIFDARGGVDRIMVHACRDCLGAGKRTKKVSCDKCQGSGEWESEYSGDYGECYACRGKGSFFRSVECDNEACDNGRDYYAYPDLDGEDGTHVVWKQARLDWTLATKPVLLDLGRSLLRVVRMESSRSPVAFVAREVEHQSVAAWIAGGPVSMRGNP